MPNQQVVPAIENHFIAGLKTEFTGLNFPENAATDSQNCVYTLIGDVLRREGINYEANFVTNVIDRTNAAVSSYKWKNVGGDGLTEVVVLQVGGTLYFFQSTNATITSPLSTTKLSSTVTLSTFTASGGSFNPTVECQFTDGNGYLFVFHPNLDSFYCTFTSGTITPNIITIQVRDFAGIAEPGVADNFRPLVLAAEHQYNLINQGWTAGNPWTASSSGAGNTGSAIVGNSVTINIDGGQTNTTSVTNGSSIQVIVRSSVNNNLFTNFIGTVTSYVTPFTSVTLLVTQVIFDNGLHSVNGVCSLSLINVGFINTWKTQIGNFPSNSDIWWLYKNTSNVFAPSTTIANVQQPFGPSPKGSFILNAFSQQRSGVSGIVGLTDVTTTIRPKTGAWFEGRVFYTGVDASFPPTGDEPFQTWTENIYFSQTVVNTTQFGRCYQTNDPTSQTLFALLPTDGGVITIQGSGSIYRLFALENGLLVFAANGIWYITGSSGIGFAANDYTVRKISNIQNISSTSFVNVNGYPMFWNEEGIYAVTPSKQGTGVGQNAMSFQVDNLCLGSILTFYQNIPKQSKKFARGDYNSIDYIVEWCYRSTNESNVTNRYQFDSVLNFNVVNKAFYPYTISITPLSNNNIPFINDIKFVQNPGGTNTPGPIFKYITSVQRSGVYNFTFSEENDPLFVDWRSEDNVGTSFNSSFITGFRLPGQGLRKSQVPYLYLFFRNNTPISSCGVQSTWDYGADANSGRWSTRTVVTNNTTDYVMLYRRLRTRGRGLVMQFRITSQPGQPFDIMGWSAWNLVNEQI